FAVPASDVGGSGSFNVTGGIVVNLTDEQVKLGFDEFMITFDIDSSAAQPVTGVRLGGTFAADLPLPTASGTAYVPSFVYLNQTLQLGGSGSGGGDLPGTINLGAASADLDWDATGTDPEAVGGCATATAHLQAHFHGDMYQCATDPVTPTR